MFVSANVIMSKAGEYGLKIMLLFMLMISCLVVNIILAVPLFYFDFAKAFLGNLFSETNY